MSSPHDAMSILQHLSQRLGRQPTLVEMMQYAGADPSGMQVDPPTQEVPSRRPMEHGDGPLTAAAQAADLLRANPELLRVREQMVRLMLFGLDQQNGLLLPGTPRYGGGFGPAPSPIPGPNVKRGIGGGGWAVGSGPAGAA